MAHVVLAEIEVFHSRPVAPTRRVALGACSLPCDPPPGFGGVLIAAIVARYASLMDADLRLELDYLLREVEAGRRIAQPRLRHRYQQDLIGLSKSRHAVVGDGEQIRFEFETKGSAEQQVLGAVYAAASLHPRARADSILAIRKALRWRSAVAGSFVAHIMGGKRTGDWTVSAIADPSRWAREVFGFESDVDVERAAVQRRFRQMLRAAHPDSGGDEDLAARRIADITEARRILLAG